MNFDGPLLPYQKEQATGSPVFKEVKMSNSSNSAVSSGAVALATGSVQSLPDGCMSVVNNRRRENEQC